MRIYYYEIIVRYYCLKCKGERRGVGRIIFVKKGDIFYNKNIIGFN